MTHLSRSHWYTKLSPIRAAFPLLIWGTVLPCLPIFDAEKSLPATVSDVCLTPPFVLGPTVASISLTSSLSESLVLGTHLCLCLLWIVFHLKSGENITGKGRHNIYEIIYYFV